MTDDSAGIRAPAEGRFMVTTRREADVLAVLLMFIFITGAVTLSLMPVVTAELRTVVGLTDAQIGDRRRPLGRAAPGG
jgi:hypothetical protein